jgi:ankyrin repeat protein
MAKLSPQHQYEINRALVNAAMSPNLGAKIDALLAGGAELNPAGKRSVLGMAVSSSRQTPDGRRISDEEIIENCKVLLAHNADINHIDALRWTPLHEAAKRYTPGVAAFLIKNKADIHARNLNGSEPLRYAQEKSGDLLRTEIAKESFLGFFRELDGIMIELALLVLHYLLHLASQYPC